MALDFSQIGVVDVVKSIFLQGLTFLALICGIRLQQKKESKREQMEIYVRNGLENQIVCLTKLKENLIYNCLMYPLLFRDNTGDHNEHFSNKIKEMYSLIEPNVSQIRMNIFGTEFCHTLESLNLVIRKQLYNLEMLASGEPKKEEFALIVFETEAILQYVIVKFTDLLNITQNKFHRRSFNNISNLRSVKKLREELKLFSGNCIKLLGTKDKEQVWDFLRMTIKITGDRLERMGILVEAMEVKNE